MHVNVQKIVQRSRLCVKSYQKSIGEFFIASKQSHKNDIIILITDAEELGLNSKNVENFYVDNLENDEISRMLGLVGAYGDMIELEEEWAFNIIKYIGNYQEIYDKNLGSKSPLNIPRGLNNLYNNGGLLYSPPFK